MGQGIKKNKRKNKIPIKKKDKIVMRQEDETMKIALLEPIGVPVEVIEEYAGKLREEGHTFRYYDTVTTDTAELIRRSEDCEVVMIANHPYPDEAVAANEKLKMISVAFTGIDHVGTGACKEKDVLVCNAAGYSDQTVAELVIGVAIDAYRRIPAADRRVREGGTSAGLCGRELNGKTIGIVGLGKIGLQTARLFQAFGCKVVAYNRSRSKEAEDAGICYLPLEDVLKESDILSVHLPLNVQTRGFIDAQKLSLMKKDAVLINCARGPVVDTAALAEALNEERLGGACVDVFDCEPPIPQDNPLLSAKNVILTPHIAYLSEESMLRRAQIVFRNVFDYLEGKPSNVCTL